MKIRIKVRWTQGPMERQGSGSVFDWAVCGADPLTVGRSTRAHLRLPHPTVSDQHLQVALQEGRLFVMDLGSRNGTLLNGSLLVPQSASPVRVGDVIGVGPFVLSLADPELDPHQEAGIGTQSLALELARQMMEADPEDRPSITIVEGQNEGTRLSLPPGQPVVIGRDPGCHLSLVDPDVSRHHAKIHCTFEGCWLTDLESKNGVFVKGRTINGAWKLQHKSRFRLGNTVLCFDDPAEIYLGALEEMADQLLEDDGKIFETGVFDEAVDERREDSPSRSSEENKPLDGEACDGVEPGGSAEWDVKRREIEEVESSGLKQSRPRGEVVDEGRAFQEGASSGSEPTRAASGGLGGGLGLGWVLLVVIGGAVTLGAAASLFLLLRSL